jgi:chromosome segregation ATPase
MTDAGDQLVRVVQRNIDLQFQLQNFNQVNLNLRQILTQYLTHQSAVPDIREELESLRKANELLTQQNRLLESQREGFDRLLAGVRVECELVNERVVLLEKQLEEEQFSFLEEPDELREMMNDIETNIQEFEQSE